MKLAIVVLIISLGVMAAMIFQTVQQEFKLHNIKTAYVSNQAEFKTKDTAIGQLKTQLKELKDSLTSVNVQVNEMQKKKETVKKTIAETDVKLKDCEKQKDDNIKKKAETDAASLKISDEYKKARHEAEKEIQTLKQKILLKDQAICAFADTTKEMARELCGMS